MKYLKKYEGFEGFDEWFNGKDNNKRKVIEDVNEIVLDLSDYRIIPIIKHYDNRLSVILQTDPEQLKISRSGYAHVYNIWGRGETTFTYKNIKDRVEHLIAYMNYKGNELTEIIINDNKYLSKHNFSFDDNSFEKDLEKLEKIVGEENIELFMFRLEFKINY